MKLDKLFIVASGIFFLAPYAATVSGQDAAQTVYELRCRGGASAFTVESARARHHVSPQEARSREGSMFVMMFKEGPRAADVNGTGLEPGTCSWIDRALSADEPRKVIFNGNAFSRDLRDASGEDQRAQLDKYFNESGHNWSFFVYNTGGVFRATQHKIFANVGVEKRRGGSAIIKP